jgi:DHA1 family inner membrane transport protein
VVFTAPHAWAISINVFLVGTIVAIGPALQIRLMDVAGHAQTLAAALNHSAFNLANALGAWLGGVAIAAGMGWTSTGWVGSLLALGGMAVVRGVRLPRDACARTVVRRGGLTPATRRERRPFRASQAAAKVRRTSEAAPFLSLSMAADSI